MFQSCSFWILIVAWSLLLPAGEGDDRVWWQAKAWLVRVVSLPVSSCHSEHMGGDVAMHWLFPNNLSPLPTN